MRIETAQGALARRGFTDAAAAERRLAAWSLHQLQLLGTIGRAADPDLALTTLDRLRDVDPDLLDRLVADERARVPRRRRRSGRAWPWASTSSPTRAWSRRSPAG